MILSISELKKYYGGIKAVDGVSLQVNKGEVFGVLGPNGSGKTTTLSIITGIVHADHGNYEWFEKAPSKHSRQRIGSLIETPNFYPYLNLIDNLKIVSNILNLENQKKEIERVLEITNLATRATSSFQTLSLGMKQRLALASVLLGNPEVLVLDEPTNGLDPEGIAEVRKIIKDEASKGKTIIIASHILDEVEKVCSHVSILKAGKTLAQGKVDELLQSDPPILVASKDMDKLFNTLSSLDMATKVIREGKYINVNLNKENSAQDLNKYLFDNGIVLSHLEEKKNTLEAQFLELIKK